MPKLSENTLPSYRLHKQSGQAIVTLNGRDFLLGPHGTAASRSEYRQRIAAWMANGRRVPRTKTDLTVTELIAAFKTHAEMYYRGPDGTPTSEVANFRIVLRPLRELYGHLPACEFGPLSLEAVRNAMIAKGWVRRSINNSIGRIKHVFKWAVSRELIPASVYHALTTLPGLRAGRTDAVESEPVRPVSDEMVERTLPHLSSTVSAMVQLQRLTGARPGEICQLRTGDICRSGAVWSYSPAKHKTRHHGYQRVIFLGPRAQQVLRPFLKPLNPEAYIFSPKDAEAERREKLRSSRRTPLTCGNRPGTNRKRRAKWTPGDRYDVNSYRRAIDRACELAFMPPSPLGRQEDESVRAWQKRLSPEQRGEWKLWHRQHHWHPHQLRHTAATEIRRRFNIEAAQHVLGHATLSITELYAEKIPMSQNG